MSNYYLILIWIGIFWILEMRVQMQRKEVVAGSIAYRMKPFWATVLVTPLVFWTANRGWIADTGSYRSMFANLPSAVGEIAVYMKDVEKDKGFYFCSALIKSIITEDVVRYFWIIAAIQAYLLFRMYRKYSTRYVVSFFLFIASTDYVSWMFNGMRQFVAVTITMLAFDYILEKRYARAILIIVLASLFHQSALLVIPFIFVVQGKAWNKKTLLFIVLIILAVTYVEEFTVLLDDALQETQYGNVVSDWEEWGDDGTNVIRVLVYAVPTILSLIGLRFIKAENDRVIHVCTNMSIISVCFYVISIFTSGIFIGRLPIYFSLYNYILLPWQLEHMFEKTSARLMYVAMIGAYLGFYIFQIRFVWGLA